MNYLLVTRIKYIEVLFSGIDKVYEVHNDTARAAYLLVLAHWIILIVANWADTALVKTLFIPGDTLAKTAGTLAIYLYTLLILVTIFRFIPYNFWKMTHKLMGVPFILAGIHALYAASDVRDYLPLKIWIGL